MCWLEALLISWFILLTSFSDNPGMVPSSAIPMKRFPPSEFAKAAISEASESAFLISTLN